MNDAPMVDDSKIFAVRDLLEKLRKGEKLTVKEKELLKKLGLED